ncbi:KH domain-containing protein [Cryptosporangium sp. NPDC048952]|uniref:KH domain-containing protein n=1 Tax=Cryptosporangium sp. NPDC048952 TaxID=3363961 RepID=UPI00371AA26F
MTDNSAFKRLVRARMAETGEKYTVARRAVITGSVLRVFVDLELTPEAAEAYAAADASGRQELVDRLLVSAADATLVSDQETAIRSAVQRAVDRLVGISEVSVGRTADRLRVTVRAARPIALVGPRGDEADRLRGELEELTGSRVSLEILEDS